VEQRAVVKGREAVSVMAVITVRDKQWSVGIASTPQELAQGLGGITGILPDTGMLFDTGWEQYITVTTEDMLFPIDVVFLSQSLVVVDLVQRFIPRHRITSVQPARFFLEVNAGEMDSIELGDLVSIDILSFQDAPVAPDWMSILLPFVAFALVGVLIVDMTKPETRSVVASESSQGGV
jgi:uncharacterized membrane protein (UPF0127 family)